MKIKSNATAEELKSPFYKINQDFCSKFESFIASKNGKVKGTYNAWSYLIYGKISNPKSWDLLYKKSTFSSSGNLFLSSKSQSLLVLAQWSTKIPNSNYSNFKIRKITTSDSIKLLFNNKWSRLSTSSSYVIKSNDPFSKFTDKIVKVLETLFLSNEVFQIEFKNDKLTIELRSEEHNFEVFNKLIKL